MSENYHRAQSINERIKKLNQNGLQIIINNNHNNSPFNRNQYETNTLPKYKEKINFCKVTNRSLSESKMAHELKLSINNHNTRVNEVLDKQRDITLEPSPQTTTTTAAAAVITAQNQNETINVITTITQSTTKTIETTNLLETINCRKKTSCSSGGEKLIESSINGNIRSKEENINELNSVGVNNSNVNNNNNNNHNNPNKINNFNKNQQQMLNENVKACENLNNNKIITNNNNNNNEINIIKNNNNNINELNIYNVNKKCDDDDVEDVSDRDVGDVIKNVNDVTLTENIKKRNSINNGNVILSEFEKYNKWEQRDIQLEQQQQQCVKQKQEQHHHQLHFINNNINNEKHLNCDKNNLIKICNKNRATLLIDTLDLELNNTKVNNDKNYHIEAFPINDLIININNKPMTKKMLSTYDNVPESWIETLADGLPDSCNEINETDEDENDTSTIQIGGIGGKTFHQVKLTKSCEDLTKINRLDDELPKKVKTTRMRLRQMRDSFGKVDRFRIKGKKLIKLFGGNLLTVEKQANSNIPRFVIACITLMNEKKFLSTEGIYRVSPKHKDVKDLIEQIERGNYKSLDNIVDPFLLAGVLKQFFISLENLLFSYELFQKYFNDEMSANCFSYNRMLDKIKKLINELKTDVERDTLKYLIEHLKHVSSLSSENRMEAANLGTIWSPCLFSNTGCTHADMLNAVQYQMKVLEIMITNYEQIFLPAAALTAINNNENINKNSIDNSDDNKNPSHDDNDNIILSVNIIPSHVILPETPQTTAFAPISPTFSIDPGPEPLTPPILIAKHAANIILPTATTSYMPDVISIPNVTSLNTQTSLSENEVQNFNVDGTKGRRNSLLFNKKKKCCIL